MSQLSVSAPPLRAGRRAPEAAALRVLPGRITTSGNGVFATICIIVLAAGMVALLLLNTALAQGAMTLGQRQRESSLLADTASNLQEQVDRASSSGALASAATALGMVRSNERGFVNLAAGTVTGSAQPATQLQAFSVVTSPIPTPSASAPAPAPAPAPGSAPAPSPAPAGTHQAGASATPSNPGSGVGAPRAARLAPTPPASSTAAASAPHPTAASPR